MSKTNSLTRSIVQFLNAEGHLAHRNNTVGVWDAKRGIYRRNQDRTAIGVGDILCCLKGGLWLEIEIKTGKDKLSPEQKMRSDNVSKRGGWYWVIGTWDEFAEIYHLIY